MASRQWLFKSLYRFGFVPWDGHPLPKSLKDLVEGDGANAALTAGKALDIGCGTGGTTRAIARLPGRRSVGVDISEPMLALARQEAERAGLPARFIRADAQMSAALFDLTA